MKKAGLTLVEVLVALVVIGIVTAFFSTSVVANFRHTTTSGQKTQSAQLLSYFGRLVAGGDPDVLPDSGKTLTWDYGEVEADFPDLKSESSFSDLSTYKVQVVSNGNVTLGTKTLGTASAVRYSVSVCYKRESEQCLTGATLGPTPTGTLESFGATGIN